MVMFNSLLLVVIKVGVGLCYFVFLLDQCFVYLINELDVIVNIYVYDCQFGILILLVSDLVLLEGFKISEQLVVVDLYLMLDGCFFYVIECVFNSFSGYCVDLVSGRFICIFNIFIEIQLCGFNIDL